MDFNSPRLRYVLPTPSSPRAPYFSDEAVNHRLWDGRSVTPVDMRPEVPIRFGFPAPVYRFEPGMLVHVEPAFEPFAMPVQTRYDGGGGYNRREIEEYEAVALRRLPPIVMMGNPGGATMSGSKRKSPPPPSPSFGSFNEFCNSKKVQEEWRCAVCEISAPSERSFNQHLRGKKHLARMESSKGQITNVENGTRLIESFVNKKTPEIKNYSIGLGVTENVVKKPQAKVKGDSNSSKTVKTRKMFNFWCKICQTGASDEKGMDEHRKGKKHLKNRRNKARVKKGTSKRKNM